MVNLLQGSKEEMEIKSTILDPEDTENNILLIRDADKKAEYLAKTIIQLKNDLFNLQKQDVGKSDK